MLVVAGLAQLALAALERLADDRIGERHFRLSHVADRQQDLGVFAGCCLIAAESRAVALGADERAAETAAALDRDRHLDLDGVASVALEVGAAHQRPIEAGRRDFQPVRLLDRVGDVEHRRQRARQRLAVVDGHGSVRPLRHDLHGAAGQAGNLHPDQAQAKPLDHRLGNRGNACRHALLNDQAGLGLCPGISRLHHAPYAAGLILKSWSPGGRPGSCGPARLTKKSGSRGNPLSKAVRITSDRYETSTISGPREYSDFAVWRKGRSPGNPLEIPLILTNPSFTISF